MNDLAEIISRNEDQIRQDWVENMAGSVQRIDLMSKAELNEQSRAILAAIVDGMRG